MNNNWRLAEIEYHKMEDHFSRQQREIVRQQDLQYQVGQVLRRASGGTWHRLHNLTLPLVISVGLITTYLLVR
jgi:hypothetical protein